MPILPTKKEFDEAANLFEDSAALNTKSLLDLRTFLHNEKRSIELVERLYSERDERFQRAMQSSAAQWLSKQKCFIDAYEMVFRLRTYRYESKDQAITATLNTLRASAKNGQEKFEKKREVVGNHRSLRAQWVGRLCMALSEYFYTNRAEEIVAKKRKMKAAVKRISVGISELDELLDDRRMYSGLSWLEREFMARAKIINASFDEDTLYPPLGRTDRTVKERLLVWRLTVLHQRLFGQRRISAIFRLLQLEGIETTWDERQIERHCALFQEWEIKRRAERHELALQLRSVADPYGQAVVMRSKYTNNLRGGKINNKSQQRRGMKSRRNASINGRSRKIPTG